MKTRNSLKYFSNDCHWRPFFLILIHSNLFLILILVKFLTPSNLPFLTILLTHILLLTLFYSKVQLSCGKRAKIFRT